MPEPGERKLAGGRGLTAAGILGQGRKTEAAALPKKGGRRVVIRVRPLGTQVPNSGRRCASCDCSRATMLECIWLTRDSLRSSVAPISFIVMSS
jgi:hypothetical protein